ncbi:hypothetical protein K4F52_007475 [Lecanicillium sp. MT-2017a]|nr:hypothetical protein K4F52_007475 [Lecanicillium sp. MT-2017a]
MFSDSLTHLVESIVDLETSLGGVARVRRFCLGTPQESDDQDETSNHATLPDHWPSTGAIEFRGVSASYRGKSTIIAVLLGMIDYTGSILIDGRELRTVPTEFLRSRIITLTQDGVQLQGTIRLNLDPYDPPDYDSGTRLADQTLITALTRVGLWETVQNCGGLDADMQASNFSEGQHQLLGIARAMLRKSYTLSKIVIFDEATSSIDNDTDRKIQALIADVFANCTVLMTSHRLYAFDKMHKVIMLNDGYIEDTLKRDPTSGLLVEA